MVVLPLEREAKPPKGGHCELPCTQRATVPPWKRQFHEQDWRFHAQQAFHHDGYCWEAAPVLGNGAESPCMCWTPTIGARCSALGMGQEPWCQSQATSPKVSGTSSCAPSNSAFPHSPRSFVWAFQKGLKTIC